MKIIVLLKQVPDTTEIKVDFETGTLIRQGVKSIMNPDDKAGLEEALKLKDKYGAHITVVTMGPAQATYMLREALAMGADDAVLLNDRKFAGSDTWATSSIIAGGLVNMEYDLIIAGRQAIDGDTAQVGPQTAEKLNIPHVTYVEEIESVEDNSITVKRQFEFGYQRIRVDFPCLITTLGEMNTPRYMHTAKIVDAMKYEIKIVTREDIVVNDEEIGLKGSPTKVKRTFTKESQSKSDLIMVAPSEAASKIVSALDVNNII
ncbi:MAG: electron transfer flavoprotein subunit beta [Bacilli bacterium]